MARRHRVRQSRRPEERPREILEAALDLFARRGYRATSIDDVASAAGVTKGAVYHYFETKEDLLVAALELRSRSVFDEAEAIATTQGGPVSVRLRVSLRPVWGVFASEEWGRLFRLLIGDVAVEHAPLFRRWATEGPLRGWRFVERMIEEGKRLGEFRADIDAAVAARQLICGLVLQGFLGFHSVIADVAPMEPDRIFDATLDHFFHGVSQLASTAGGDLTARSTRPGRAQP